LLLLGDSQHLGLSDLAQNERDVGDQQHPPFGPRQRQSDVPALPDARLLAGSSSEEAVGVQKPLGLLQRAISPFALEVKEEVFAVALAQGRASARRIMVTSRMVSRLT